MTHPVPIACTGLRLMSRGIFGKGSTKRKQIHTVIVTRSRAIVTLYQAMKYSIVADSHGTLVQ